MLLRLRGAAAENATCEPSAPVRRPRDPRRSGRHTAHRTVTPCTRLEHAGIVAERAAVPIVPVIEVYEWPPRGVKRSLACRGRGNTVNPVDHLQPGPCRA